MIETPKDTFEIKRGRDFSATYEVDYDITDMSYKSEIRKQTTKELVATFVIDKDIANKRIILSLTDTITNGLDGNDLVADVLETNASGFDRNLVDIQIVLYKSVTQK